MTFMDSECMECGEKFSDWAGGKSRWDWEDRHQEQTGHKTFRVTVK